MPQIDDPLAEHDAAGRTIGQISALGRNLGGQAERVGRASAGDLYPRAGLPGKRPRDVIGSGRERAELRMHLGEVVEAARQAAQPAALSQPRERLIDRRAGGHVQEVAGREDAAAPAGAGALHDPVRN